MAGLDENNRVVKVVGKTKSGAQVSLLRCKNSRMFEFEYGTGVLPKILEGKFTSADEAYSIVSRWPGILPLDAPLYFAVIEIATPTLPSADDILPPEYQKRRVGPPVKEKYASRKRR